MDDTMHFMELSALLTGLNDSLLKDPDHTFNTPIAEEYARRLRGTFSEKFTALLEAYQKLAVANPKPPIDDALLAALRADPAFTANEFAAKQIVNIWYFSQFEDEAGEIIDGGFYEEGAVWTLVKSHPIGFSTQLHAYWTRAPSAG